MIDEPGRYLVQVALELPTGEHLVSNPLTIRVAPPKQVEHERLASDYLSEEVARIYSFGGSRVLKAGNEALQEVAARMGDEPVARHAHLMLGRPLADDFKLLKMRSVDSPMEVKAASEVGAEIRKERADIPAAEEHLLTALDNAPVAAETLGHIRFKRSVDRFSTMLEEQGEHKVAAAVVGQAKRALEARGVIQPVVDELADRHERLLAATGTGTNAATRRRSRGKATKEAKEAAGTRTTKAARTTRAAKAATAASPARTAAPRRRATTR
jgi:hypothetical protein